MQPSDRWWLYAGFIGFNGCQLKQPQRELMQFFVFYAKSSISAVSADIINISQW